MLIERINEDTYAVDGKNIGDKVNLWNLMNHKSDEEIRFKQVKFMIDHRAVSRFMQSALPGIEYVDKYYDIETTYPREVSRIKPHYSVVSAEEAHVHVKHFRTSTGRPDKVSFILNEDRSFDSVQKLSDALCNLKIYLSEGQIRFILAHGLNEEQIAKYPRLRFTNEEIKYEVDRRSAVQVDNSSSSEKSVIIQRIDDVIYHYNGVVMDSFRVREALQEDGFIINKNVLSMIFGQGKIPKSVADRYPNLKYKDLR